MSTYRKAGRRFFLYDFDIGGHRFYGSTKCTSKREADAFERAKKSEARKQLEEVAALGRQAMTFGVASTRYWEEVGQFAETSAGIEWSLAWLQREIGKGARLSTITGATVARLVHKRRQDKVRRGEADVAISNATVNRTVTEVLRRILKRAGEVWREPVAVIRWRDHLLKEPEERVRELRSDEEEKLFERLRPDYHPIVRFALLSGCRLNECVSLRWKDVDWGGRQIWIKGKGDKLAPIPMPPSVRELLWPLQGQHSEFVFTYVAKRADENRRVGSRYPITYEGLKTAFRRFAKTALPGYRFHDNRHTAATRVMRVTGNLKITQKLLRHTSITTTTKYAHVVHDEVLDAMEKAAKSRSATNIPDFSPDAGDSSRKKAK